MHFGEMAAEWQRRLTVITVMLGASESRLMRISATGKQDKGEEERDEAALLFCLVIKGHGRN